MGQAKNKQYSREKFLLLHPWCIYCGAKATTTDHCPPRCFFEGRKWPETYEFPACDECNAEARLDEQALAVLMRLKTTESSSDIARSEWVRLLAGVNNNQPQVVAEWSSQHKFRYQKNRALRESFGELGNMAVQAGWSVINMGPLTLAAIERFMIKLAKALYYRHIGVILDGDVIGRYVNTLSAINDSDVTEGMLRFAPELAEIRRQNDALNDQFIYRYNYSPQFGAFYGVVRFSDQFVFQVLAASQELADRVTADRIAAGNNVVPENTYHCPLKHKPQPAF